MMKNIWFMLLTVCTMFAFSACSDDDEKNPTNPVSNAKVPATVQIGEEMIITGTGFTAPGIALYLEDAEKNRTKLDATFSAAGATCTVPELTPGTFGVILTQEGHEWELGKTALEAGPNPIVSPALPEGIVYIGKQVTIGGSGYEASDKISLKQEEGDAIEISEVAVTEIGLQFTLPKDLPAGTYMVSLIRGVQSWTLEGTLNVQKEKRIKSISVENAMGKIDITMTYNENNQLTIADAHVNAMGQEADYQYNFTYTEEKITTTGQANDIPLEYFLKDGKITKSTACMAYDETEAYNLWNYDAKNYLSAIQNMGNGSYEAIDIPTVSYNAEGNMEQLTLSGINEYNFIYGDDAPDAVQGTLDLSWAPHFIMMISWGMGEDIGIGLLLNQNGYTSAKIPTKISYVGYDGQNHEYAITTQWTNDYTLTSVCDDEENIGSTTVVYEDIE